MSYVTKPKQPRYDSQIRCDNLRNKTRVCIGDAFAGSRPTTGNPRERQLLQGGGEERQLSPVFFQRERQYHF